MTISLANLILVGFAILGLWKLYNLLFPKRKEQKINEWELKAKLLDQFFAEFTYKTMEQNNEFKPAPKEVYDFLGSEFSKWLEAKTNEIKK